VTDELYSRVEKYCLPERMAISQDGEVVRAKDIVYLTIEGKDSIAVTENKKNLYNR
jgi:hypothetical protein